MAVAATCHPERPHKAKGLCGPCYNVAALKENPEQREHVRNYMRGRHLKKYGITEEQYQEMLAEQGGLCKLCLGPPRGRWKKLHVDHNHTTGHVRGLLCHHCNYKLIGAIEADPQILTRVQEYLGL